MSSGCAAQVAEGLSCQAGTSCTGDSSCPHPIPSHPQSYVLLKGRKPNPAITPHHSKPCSNAKIEYFFLCLLHIPGLPPRCWRVHLADKAGFGAAFPSWCLLQNIPAVGDVGVEEEPGAVVSPGLGVQQELRYSLQISEEDAGTSRWELRAEGVAAH